VARTIENLLRCTDENIAFVDGIGNLQHNTEFDNLAEQDLPRIKQWVLREGRLFHKKLRTYLARDDRDITPNKQEGARGSKSSPEPEKLGGKVFIGTFSLTTAAQEDASMRPKTR